MRSFRGKLNQKQKAVFISLLRSVLHACDLESAIMAKILLLEKLLDNGLEEIAEWIEETIDDALNVFNLPVEHRKRIRSTNMLERLNEEIRRRNRVLRIFPNRESCTRLQTAVCQEISETWEGRRYLTFERKIRRILND